MSERIGRDDGAEMAIVESSPRQDGRNMTMVLHPTKKPKTPSKRTNNSSNNNHDEDGGEDRTTEPAPTQGA